VGKKVCYKTSHKKIREAAKDLQELWDHGGGRDMHKYCKLPNKKCVCLKQFYQENECMNCIQRFKFQYSSLKQGEELPNNPFE
jgi:hypothetical protein